MLHSSLYQPVVTYVPYVIPFKISTATFPSQLPNIWYTNASIWSVSLKPKATSALTYSLSFHQINASPRTFRTPLLTASYYEKYVPTFATKPPYSPDQENASSHPVTMLSFASCKTSDRAASVPRSIFSSNTVDCSVNSLNSFYVVGIKPFLLNLQHLWFQSL